MLHTHLQTSSTEELQGFSFKVATPDRYGHELPFWSWVIVLNDGQNRTLWCHSEADLLDTKHLPFIISSSWTDVWRFIKSPAGSYFSIWQDDELVVKREHADLSAVEKGERAPLEERVSVNTHLDSKEKRRGGDQREESSAGRRSCNISVSLCNFRRLDQSLHQRWGSPHQSTVAISSSCVVSAQAQISERNHFVYMWILFYFPLADPSEGDWNNSYCLCP